MNRIYMNNLESGFTVWTEDVFTETYKGYVKERYYKCKTNFYDAKLKEHIDIWYAVLYRFKDETGKNFQQIAFSDFVNNYYITAEDGLIKDYDSNYKDEINKLLEVLNKNSYNVLNAFGNFKNKYKDYNIVKLLNSEKAYFDYEKE